MLSPAKATHRAALAVVVLTFILNLMSRMGETFAVFLLPIEAEFEWNRATLSTVYGLYMGAHGVSGILIGALVDRVGPRLVYTLGLLLYSTAFFLAQFANAPLTPSPSLTAITTTLARCRWHCGSSPERT